MWAGFRETNKRWGRALVLATCSHRGQRCQNPEKTVLEEGCQRTQPVRAPTGRGRQCLTFLSPSDALHVFLCTVLRLPRWAFKKKKFIYLAASDLRCGTWDLCCSMQDLCFCCSDMWDLIPCCSVTKLCLTLCDLMDCMQHARLPRPSPAPGVCSNSLSFESVMSPNHLVFCCPLLLLPSIFPSIRVFPMSWLFVSGGQNIGASASASVLSTNIQGWFPLGLTVLISLKSNRLSRAFSNTTVH